MSKLSERSLVSAQLLSKFGAWRAPICMVDRIADFTPGEKGSITVVKYVSFNEPYISGHFPGNPVMPGVMIAEIFGQASEYFSLLNDFCNIYQSPQVPVGSLKKFDDVAKALATEEGERVIIKRRESVSGFLAAQDLKFKKVVYPGDAIYVESKLGFADAQGFHHYLVEARVGRYVVAEGKIINFRIENDNVLEKMVNNLSR